jgi:hypothetical protein
MVAQASAASAAGRAREQAPIVVLAACSDRKSVRIDHALRLREVHDASVEARVEAWRARLRDPSTPAITARELYAGDHWQAVLRGVSALESLGRVDHWVVSAGQGLISASKAIPAYSATFASRQADSVWRGRKDGSRPDVLRTWWRGISRDKTLLALARSTSTPLLLVAGSDYLDALADEIEDVVTELGEERLITFSAGSGHPTALQYDASYGGALGGTNAALNARAFELVAASAKSVGELSRAAATAALDTRRSAAPPLARPARAPATDDAVLALVAALRRDYPGVSRTAALRAVRGSGVACSQERFAQLFAQRPTEAQAG